MSKTNFTYTLRIGAEISDLIAKTNQAKQSMSSLMAAGKIPGVERIFDSLTKSLEKLQSKANQPIASMAAFEGLKKEVDAIETAFDRLGTSIDKLNNLSASDKFDLLPPNSKKTIESINAALGVFSTALEKVGIKSKELTDKEIALTAAQKELKKAEGRVSDKEALVAVQKQMVDKTKEEAAAIKSKIDILKKFQATSAAYEAADGDKRKAGGGKAELKGLNLPADRAKAAKTIPGLDLKDTTAVENKITELNEQYKSLAKTVTDVENILRRYMTQLNEAGNAMAIVQSKVGSLNEVVDQLNAEFERNRAVDTQAAYAQLRSEAERLGADLTALPLDYTEQNFESLQTVMQELATNQFSQINAEIDTAKTSMHEAGDAVSRLGDQMVGAGEECAELDKIVSNTTAIAERIRQFVGLQGAISILRTAMYNAIATIKELDGAMAEMAVVTELDVGDYWSQLPEYTRRANELGTSIKDVYNAATLFYQQGLKTNEVIALSNETLKMARIANLSAEDATNKMTAALRGFNMELSQTNAQRINDVYSELAAITASDVDEISTAMTKTASIAASAGMEFETTAALLAQGIETTRESADSIGTSLKTVIARFQELKKAPEEIGEVDGEIVDANKIETALRSVGISLRDAQGQFRNLDDVLLELSSVWNTLDINTQRYIATVAAGSRQQSRFLAMISDYSRTQELVAAANNSAGAANQQFEKTMDSLESKLNKLKNAWDSFTMGIADNTVLKAGVDALTGILTAINNVTDAFGDFSGVAKMGVLIGSLAVADRALNGFMGSLKTGSTVFQAFGAGGASAANGVRDALSKLTMTMNKVAGFTIKTDTRTATKSIESYTKAMKKSEAAKKDLRELDKKTDVDEQVKGKMKAKLSAEEAAAQAAKTAAVNEYAIATGLSNDQAAIAISLQTKGVSADMAAALAKDKTNKELKEKAIQEMIAAGATEQEARANVENALSEKGNNNQKKKGLATLWAKITGFYSSTAAIWAESIAHATNTTMEKTESGVTWQLVAAKIALGAATLGAGAALALLVVGIVAAVKAYKKNDPEAKMKALQEACDEAKETAEETKTALEEMMSAKTEYDELKTQVETLTEGTTAWKEAVADLNEKVLELIGLYPQLAKYLNFGEGGNVSMSSEGWNSLISSQQNKARLASANNLVRQLEKTESNSLAEYVTEYLYDSEGHSYQKETLQGVTFYKSANGGKIPSSVDASELYDPAAALNEILEFIDNNKPYEEVSAEIAKVRQEFENHGLSVSSYQLSLNELEEVAQRNHNQQNMQRLALSQAGSLEAQNYDDYSKIIDSLVDQYRDISENSQNASEGKWKEGSLWIEGSKKITVDLNTELTDAGLNPEDYVTDVQAMAALLEAKGGKAYTQEELDELGKGADDELAEKLAEVYQTEGIGDIVDKLYEQVKQSADLQDLYSGSLDIDLPSSDSIRSLLNNGVGPLEEAEEKALQDAIEARIKTVESLRDDTNLELKKIYDLASNEGAATTLFGTYDDAQRFIRMYNELSAGVGEAMATNFADMMRDLEADEREQFYSQYGKINFASAIEGASTLKEMLSSVNEEIRDFAAATLLLEQDAYSATAQINEAFKTLSEDTLTELTEDGKISASEILELAKSNKKLSQMMDNTGVSAATLGKYYKLLADETLNTYEATDTFIKVLDKLNAAQNTINNAFGFIDTFEAERSQTEISSYFDELRQSINDLYGKGAYGDPQLISYFEAFLGENWSKLIDQQAGDIGAAMERAMTFIDSYGENLYGAWVNLAQIGIDGISLGEDGEIGFDLAKIGSVENLKKQIQAQGWSEEMADALIADAQTFSYDLAHGLNQLGLEDAFTTWLNNVMVIGNKNVIAMSQVRSMAQELGVTAEELTNDLKKQKIEVLELVTSSGTLAGDLRDQLIENAQEVGNFDLDTNYQLMLELGLDDKEAKEELKTMAKTLTGVNFTLDGKTLEKTEDQTLEAVVEGTINGLEDPAVKAAQELSASKQGEMIANAVAAGMITALSKFTDNYTDEQRDNDIDDALSIITNRYASEQSALKEAIKKVTTSTADNSVAVQALLEKYQTATEGFYSSYTSAAAQATGLKQSDTKYWESPYDEIYNLNQELNAIIREREKLERRYNRALEDSTTSVQQLADIAAEELYNLQSQANVQKNISRTALGIIENERKNNAKFEGYYNFDDKTYAIQVDWVAAQQANWTDEVGQEFEDFISKLEEEADSAREAQDALDDIQDSIDEIAERGREDTSQIYDSVKEGLIKKSQKQIDELQNINDSIQDAQSQMLDAMQSQIDATRKTRENAKTETELANKRTRLAYLQRDTSGGNTLDILKLQKEIDDAEQSYSDSLVDQSLQQLQDASDEAAEQRQRQIDLAQAQLDAYSESSQIWGDVKQLVDDGFAQVAKGLPFAETEAGHLAALDEGVEQMNPLSAEDFYKELEQSAKEGAIYEGFVSITGEDEDGDGMTIKGLAATITKDIEGWAEEAKTAVPVVNVTVYKDGSSSVDYGGLFDGETDQDDDPQPDQERSFEENVRLAQKLAEKRGITYEEAYFILTGIDISKKFTGSAPSSPVTIANADNFLERSWTQRFASGGIADFTGPAWLDGTRSHPELVLNATDTENFILLKDILSDILNSTGSTAKATNAVTGGDNYYDIDISVESLSDDYDVEQLAGKVKDLIYDDSAYRNVNAINYIR